MGFGALLAVTEARTHKRQAKLQELRPLVNEALQITQSKLGLQMQEAILEIQRELEKEARERIKEAHRLAQESRQRCQQQLQASAAEKKEAADSAEASLELLSGLGARCQARQDELSALLQESAI